jgi:hypothetical protein
MPPPAPILSHLDPDHTPHPSSWRYPFSIAQVFPLYQCQSGAIVNISYQDTFLRWGLVSTSPNLQAGGSPLVVSPTLVIQYIRSHPPYWRPFLHPQPEDAPCRGNRETSRTVSSILQEMPEYNQLVWRRKVATLTPVLPIKRAVIYHGKMWNTGKSEIQQPGRSQAIRQDLRVIPNDNQSLTLCVWLCNRME